MDVEAPSTVASHWGLGRSTSLPHPCSSTLDTKSSSMCPQAFLYMESMFVALTVCLYSECFICIFMVTISGRNCHYSHL